MTRLTAGKKAQKKQSQFQKLWVKAEKLKRENACFRDRLDEIMHRIRNEIQPVKKQTDKLQIPLIKRLLTLGQRKSLAQWQRQELHDWIHELIEPLQSTNSIDAELLEDIARYDAFRSGVELDEASSTPLVNQLQEHIEQEERQAQEEDQVDEEAFRKAIHDEVEEILDQTFGPEPPRAESHDKPTDDLFQDELNEELERQTHEYHKARKAAREELLEEMLADSTDFSEDEDEDFYNSGFNPFGSNEPYPENSNDNTPAISNEVFKRLFRATAGRLHPDRESDPDSREKKHGLMTQLLSARKQGDVMTIVEMHQQYVGDDTALSKADEKQLINALKRQIDELECEQEEYSFESPLHRVAFEQYYYPSTRKTDQAFKQRIKTLEQKASEAEARSMSIKSIKTLKPYLEQRYENHQFVNPLEALFGFKR